MPEIPSPSRGSRSNAVGAALVLLALVLAVVWLGSGGDGAPTVPTGLPAAPPANVPAAAAGAEAGEAVPHPAASPRHARRTPVRRAPRHARAVRTGRPRRRSPAVSRASAPAPAAGAVPAPASPGPEFALG